MADIHPPRVSTPEGCLLVELPMGIASGRSLTSGLGASGDDRMRLRMFKRMADGYLIGKAWFGPGADGPPDHVHGGAIAYVLDEAMGAVAWMNDYPVVAAKISFEFFKMSPLRIDFDIEAKVLKADRKRVHVEAELKFPSGELCVRANGEFALLTEKKIKALQAERFDPKGLLKNPNLKWAKDDAR